MSKKTHDRGGNICRLNICDFCDSDKKYLWVVTIGMVCHACHMKVKSISYTITEKYFTFFCISASANLIM